MSANNADREAYFDALTRLAESMKPEIHVHVHTADAKPKKRKGSDDSAPVAEVRPAPHPWVS